ncbi:MAG: peptide-methionine (S)-S-oxide reductase MsrA [Methylococcales bacterium]|nr:peptide-methionine (S)-S-oxide reductase MsrA [Methylococcales bacterium]MBT7409537.1 peptide-methionine (S)-S-oxide reductase MsrA [Methylococcales bacterium]
MKQFIFIILFLLSSQIQAKEIMAQQTEIAFFAGGCFWCMEGPFDKLNGVKSTVSGYIGGHKKNPTYKQVSVGSTGHTEAIRVIYDPSKVSYQTLLNTFWHNIDPTVKNRQFCDAGSQYRSGIFYLNPQQKMLAEQSKKSITSDFLKGKKIVTEITQATQFYPAEDYHQNYYTKNPARYSWYRYGCGRDARLEKIWGKPLAGH